jgi:hypothetical protein
MKWMFHLPGNCTSKFALFSKPVGPGTKRHLKNALLSSCLEISLGEYLTLAEIEAITS